MFKFLLILGVPWILGASASTCPWDEPNLASFAALYPNPTIGTDVTITSRTRFDVTNLNVNSIVISGNGALIFNNIDVTIRTKEIRIKENGSLIIGDENCRYEKNADIILFGDRTTNRSLLDDCGEKAVCVSGNGTLKMYGKDKLPWTKINATINMPSYTYRHRTDSSVNKYKQWTDGLSLTILNPDLTRKSYEVYGIWKEGDVSASQGQVNALINDLNDVNDGEVVALAVHNFFDYESGVDVSTLHTTVESLSGIPISTSKLRLAIKYDAYALVFKKVASGETPVFNQSFDPAKGKYLTHARTGIILGDKKVVSVSHVDSESKAISYIDVQVFPKEEGQPILTLREDVSNQWKRGDQVVIASTDYSWHHNELREIEEVNVNQVTLNEEFDYRHFGKIENAVDMRAEIGNLNRNIKIRGEMSDGCPSQNENCELYNYDTYGAHIKVIQSFNGVHIEGVEISEAGQVNDKGFYPIHFHLCGYVGEKEAVVKRTSIHNSFRAVAIHGIFGKNESSPGVQVIETVAYNILGHAIFLESGAEKATLLEKNMVVHVRKVKGEKHFFKSDLDRPSAYWVSTPEVKMVDNVAAGSVGFGAWSIYPVRPVGVFPPGPLAASIQNVYEEEEAFRTKLFTFDNNVFHSNDRGGYNFDNIHLNDDGESGLQLPYDPRVDPLNETSAYDPAIVTRLTVYKNRVLGVWWRNGGVQIWNSSFAESRKLLQFAGKEEQSQYVYNSVFVGKSEGNNEDLPNYPDAFGWSGKDVFDHYQGLAVYDGPVYVYNSSFKGFKSEPDDSIVAGAISPVKNLKYASSPVTGFRNIVFEGNDPNDINRVFFGHPANNSNNGFTEHRDGNEAITFVDYDGSIVGCVNQTFDGPYQIYPLEKFAKTEKTFYRENWQAAYSNDAYGKVALNVLKMGTEFDKYNQARRINRNTSEEVYEDNNGRDGREYLTVLNRTDEFLYELQFVNGFPLKVRIDARVSGRFNDVLVGLCLPDGTTLDDMSLVIRTPNNIEFSNAVGGGIVQINEYPVYTENPNMNKVYLKDRMLYFLFRANIERDPSPDQYDDKHCPGDHCPEAEITLNSQPDPSTYTPCFNIPSGEVNIDISPGIEEDCIMPAKTRDLTWGAGDYFTSISQWGPWQEWSACTCDGISTGVKTRTRSCIVGIGRKYCEGSYGEMASCDGNCPAP